MSRRPRLSTFEQSAEGRTIKPENVKAATLQKAKRNAVYAVGDKVAVGTTGNVNRLGNKIEAVVLAFRSNPIFGNVVEVELNGKRVAVTCERVTAR